MGEHEVSLLGGGFSLSSGNFTQWELCSLEPHFLICKMGKECVPRLAQFAVCGSAVEAIKHFKNQDIILIITD